MLGDFDLSAIVYGKFLTARSTDGTPTTLLGTPALAVYKDAGTTESTAGVSLTVDFDARTGLNQFAIDTSADGAFYAAGGQFAIVITAGTVNGISAVGYVVESFTLRKAYQDKAGYALSAAAITAIWAEIMEGAVSAVQLMRGFASVLLGLSSGLDTTTAKYRDLANTKDRVSATVDANGNRSAVTRDLT